METTGKVYNASIDFRTGKPVLSILLNNKNSFNDEYNKIKDIDNLDIIIKKHRNKRSLDANAYLWLLLQKMAEVLESDKDTLYLDMLGKYGVFTHLIVKENVVDRIKAEWRLVKELGPVNVNGNTGIQLQCYFGSSTYDTKEMSVLLNGVINECHDLNIETKKQDEMDKMIMEWAKEDEENN